MAKLFPEKKYKGWSLKTESNVFSDFTFQTLKNQLPSIEGGGFPSFRISPPEPIGPCNYFDIRKGSSAGTYFVRFNIMLQDGTRRKYHSEDVNEDGLEKMLRTLMDRNLLPFVNRWSTEIAEG